MTINISLIFVNLVTPKVLAKHEHSFNKPASVHSDTEAGSLNRSSCLAPALGVTKFIIAIDMILVTLCCAT